MPVIQNDRWQFDYLGVLNAPDSALWTNPNAIAAGLYQSLMGFHAGPSAFSINAEPGLIAADLGPYGKLRVTADSIELTAPDYLRETITFSDVVERAVSGFRAASPTAQFSAHYFTISLDSHLSEGTSVDFLTRLTPLRMPGIGENLGTGLIFHSRFPQHNWQVHLTLDHSSLIQFGIAVRIIVMAGVNEISVRETVDWQVRVLREVLAGLGLTLETGVG